jgi:hypothetical protein
MLSEIPEQDESDSDITLVDELDDNITWFELDGDQVEHVQIYHELNDGCIGEDDSPEEGEKGVEMGEQASSADVEMEGESALNIISDAGSQGLTSFGRWNTGRLDCRDGEAHMQDRPRSQPNP